MNIPFPVMLYSLLALMHINLFNYTAVSTDLAKSKLELDVPVYTILIACVNFAFDSIHHKLDLSALHFCEVIANCCIYTPLYRHVCS